MSHEDQIEWDYRYQERLAILCGGAHPNQDQIAIAQAEAWKWLADSNPQQNLF